MLLPPIALLAVVLIGLAGRDKAVPPGGPAVAVAEAASALPGTTEVSRRAESSGPAVTPSPRSDWPAAMATRTAPPTQRKREEGTDGLMGGIPFGLPNDNPYPTAERQNRFTRDDEVAATRLDTTPPWVRRLGALSNYRTDPYQR